MKIHVSISEEDYIAYNVYHYFHSPSTKNNVLFGRFLPLIISVLAIVIFIIAETDPMFLYAEIAVLALYSVIGFFQYPKTAKKNIRKNILKYKKEGKLPYSEEATLDFGEDEIVETSQNNVKHIPYSSVLSVHETENYVYIMFGALEAIIIPFRYLEDKDGFLELINRKCKCAAC